MKKLLKSYITFTRTERMGLVGLCALLIILVAIRVCMPLCVHNEANTEKEKKLVTAWEAFKRTHPATSDSVIKDKNDYQDAFDDNQSPLPNIIDINTADSATLVRLKGIGPATAGKIIERRKTKGPFKSVNELLEIGHISNATFEILKQHLTVNTSLNRIN